MVAAMNRQMGMSREANRFEALLAWERAITGDPEAFRTNTVIVDGQPEEFTGIARIFTIALNGLGINYRNPRTLAHCWRIGS